MKNMKVYGRIIFLMVMENKPLPYPLTLENFCMDLNMEKGSIKYIQQITVDHLLKENLREKESYLMKNIHMKGNLMMGLKMDLAYGRTN